jgi:zinc-ribbon domain
MSGLMRRLTRGRAATDDEATPQASAASEPVGAPADAPQGDSAVPGDEANTAVLPAADAPGRDLPAGVDAAELAQAPTSEKRGRLRRRLGYLRAVREILLRDLGGFYLEAHRSEQGVDAHRRLLDAKATRLTTVESEMRDLEARLEEPHAATVIREPGVGGTCPHCGELYSSEARFCSRCGHPLTGRVARPRTSPAAVAAPPPGGEEKATTASLWGRPKRPDSDPPTAGPVAAPSPEAAAADGEPAPAREDEPAPTGSKQS